MLKVFRLTVVKWCESKRKSCAQMLAERAWVSRELGSKAGWSPAVDSGRLSSNEVHTTKSLEDPG